MDGWIDCIAVFLLLLLLFCFVIWQGCLHGSFCFYDMGYACNIFPQPIAFVSLPFSLPFSLPLPFPQALPIKLAANMELDRR